MTIGFTIFAIGILLLAIAAVVFYQGGLDMGTGAIISVLFPLGGVFSVFGIIVMAFVTLANGIS